MGRIGKKVLSWILCLMMAVGMLPVATRNAKAASAVVEISSYQDLLKFAQRVNNGETALNAEITVGEINASASDPQNPGYEATLAWTPIGDSNSPYTGTFDGNGCTIKWLTIDSADTFIGLFGYVGKDETNTGSVQNVTLEGGSIKGSNAVGGVVGFNDGGTVLNCYNTGDVEGDCSSVGGVVGFNAGGTVLNCYNTGDVTGIYSVGGVAGDNVKGTVSNCYNTGDVTGNLSVGGVAGDNAKGTVSNCYNTGAVRNEIGDNAGGVAGKNSGIVSNCYNTGDVTGKNSVGGVAGDNNGSGEGSGEVSNCYNTGDVSGIARVGGVAGNNGYYGTVSNCYNTGDVEGDSNVGGVVGYNAVTVSNCYYNQSTCQKGAIGGGNSGTNVAGLTTAEMTGNNASTNLKPLADAKNEQGEKIWIIHENAIDTYFYPHLKGFAYDTTKNVKDWSATISSGYTYELDSDAFDYDGKVQKPKVTVKKNGDEVEGAPYSFAFVESVNAGEYTIEFENTETHVKGVIPYSIKKRVLKITADSDTKVYDGTALTKDSVSAEGLATGDKIESFFVTGSQTVVGKSDNTPSEAKIVNASGKDVTKCYEITYAKGTLEVTKKALTITADSDTKVYDKTALTKDSYTVSGLAEGDTIESVTINGSRTEAGESDNVPSAAKIIDANGQDVTSYYNITYKKGKLTVTAAQAPDLTDDQKPDPKKDLKEDGKEQVLVLDPEDLPEGYTLEYSTDGGETWTQAPVGTESGEYKIEVRYKADENHTDFFGDIISVTIQGVYNLTESDGNWTKGSGKTFTFRIKKAHNDEKCFDNHTGVIVDGKSAEKGKDYTATKGSTIITFSADFLETLSVGEHMIKVTFKDGETSFVLKVLAPVSDTTPTTGDTSMPVLWAMLILISMVGTAVLIEKKRREA